MTDFARDPLGLLGRERINATSISDLQGLVVVIQQITRERGSLPSSTRGKKEPYSRTKVSSLGMGDVAEGD